MRTNLAKLASLLSPLLLPPCLLPSAGAAPIEIQTALLPHRAGDRLAGFYGEITPPANAFSPSALAQEWNFSRLQDDAEYTMSREVMPGATSPYGKDFPAVAYTVREETDAKPEATYSYYALGPAGRTYFGFADPNLPPQVSRVFEPPTTDLPARLKWNDHWTRQEVFNDTVDYLFFVSRKRVTFDASATVDGFGSIRLPLGSQSALRVRERHHYHIVDIDAGFPDEDYYVEEVYWVTQELGIVVELYSPATAEPTSGSFFVETGFRVATAKVAPLAPLDSAELGASEPAGTRSLHWPSQPSDLEYLVLRASDPAGPWDYPTATATNSLSVETRGASGFFRVLVRRPAP